MIVTALANVARVGLEAGDRASLEQAREAVAMADRVFTLPDARQVTAYVVLAETQLAAGSMGAARTAWQHASDLLSQLHDPKPGSARQLERVRALICARASVWAPCTRG